MTEPFSNDKLKQNNESMILSCQNISKSFNEKSILNDVSFHIEDHDKAAIVGINGAGKTTLLRIITGEMTADTGIVTLAKGKSFGYLAQNQNVNSENTIYDELLSVKADVIALEKQLRETEIAMKTADEEALNQLMESYTRLNHAFELANGYAYKSELTGVLKGLGFAEGEFDIHSLRRPKDKGRSFKTPFIKTGSYHFG